MYGMGDVIDEQSNKIEELRKALYAACERLNDGSAWADDSEKFHEMCKLSGHSHPALTKTMTVKELIEKLTAFPPDYEMEVKDSCHEENSPNSLLGEELFIDMINRRVTLIYHVER